MMRVAATGSAVRFADLAAPADDLLLDGLQRAAFDYFVQAGNPANGLVADTSRQDSPVDGGFTVQ
jgi:hypothetical protein